MHPSKKKVPQRMCLLLLYDVSTSRVRCVDTFIPDRPKRNQSSYMIFYTEQRDGYKRDKPSITTMV